MRFFASNELDDGLGPCDPDSQCCLADHDPDCQRFEGAVDVLKEVVALPTQACVEIYLRILARASAHFTRLAACIVRWFSKDRTVHIRIVGRRA